MRFNLESDIKLAIVFSVILVSTHAVELISLV
jgi:hypothetical protein